MERQIAAHINRPVGVSAFECEDCGEAIPETRRAQVMGCTRCVDCQSDFELIKKHLRNIIEMYDMANIHFVNLDDADFFTIRNNKNRCIGVLNNGCEEACVEILDRVNQCFIVKSVGIENIFDNQNLSTEFKKGDYVVLSLEGGYDWLDDIEQRITVLIDEVYYLRDKLDNPSEVNISFYEYSLLTPEHFFYEGANEEEVQTCSSVSAGVCE